MISRATVIYFGLVVPAAKSRDGETEVGFAVTTEANGSAVWFRCEDGDVLVKYFTEADAGPVQLARDAAIDLAVAKAAKARRRTPKAKRAELP